jgi:hypothetical protein
MGEKQNSENIGPMKIIDFLSGTPPIKNFLKAK